MKKMMLLAVMVALAAMMLAAAPALAQQERVTICHFPPGNPANAHTITVGAPGAEAHLRQHELDFRGTCEGVIIPGPGQPGDRDGQGPGRDNVADVVPAFEINQETEQECESGDVNQSFDVSQTGDNSNQTVGLQGTANTGCAQNAIGVVDAGGLVGDFAGDNVFVDDNDRFFNDGRLICFEENGDGDSNLNGIADELECRFVDDGRFDDGFIGDGFVCFDENGNRTEDERRCVFVDDFFGDDVFINDDDDFNVRGVGDGTEFEIEDSGASIDMSPTNTVESSQQVNQAASAAGPTYYYPPYPYTPHWK